MHSARGNRSCGLKKKLSSRCHKFKSVFTKMPPKSSWVTHKIPENTQQRLSYLNACQEWFAHTREHQMPLENSCVNVVQVENAGDVIDNVFYDSNQIICLGSSHRSQCILCKSELVSKTLYSSSLNPFSNIHCLNCNQCFESAK